ncbi:hypothetical protein [Thermocrispum municipale]|jgi:hypothetical protein|uniref:hypothetical protein n=1 Tax=Thermocrispum municipale TaxID=37926 RepID=UPI0003FCC6CB|nr:hypothetical protein [Thermocrispum municipale]
MLEIVITVHTIPGIQSAATARHLDRTDVDYEVEPHEALRMAWAACHRVVRGWSGYCADRPEDAVADLRSAA